MISGDGFCDDEANTPQCFNDLMDCCNYGNNTNALCNECLCYAPEINFTEYAHCSEEEFKKWEYSGIDEKCDLKLNNIENFFDNGDCCLNETVCQEYLPNTYLQTFGSAGEWVNIPCPEHKCIKSTNYCIKELLGDGVCHDQNNSKFCDWDMGDCCKIDRNEEFCCICRCRDLHHPLYSNKHPNNRVG